MDIYTTRFALIAFFMLIVITIGGIFVGLSPVNLILFLLVGYFSVIASPAKIFAQTENRMPTPGELARFPL